MLAILRSVCSVTFNSCRVTFDSGSGHARVVLYDGLACDFRLELGH